MERSIKKEKNIIIDVLKKILLIIGFVLLLFFYNGNKIEMAIFLIYIFTLYNAFNINRNLNLTFLFLLSFGLFNLGKIIVSIIFFESWGQGYFFHYYILESEVQNFILNSLLYHILSINIGIFIYRILNRKKENGINIKNDKNLEKISCIGMKISVVPLIFKYKLEYNFVKNNGYLSLYNGDFLNYQFPIWLKGWNIIFTYSFYLFLVSIPNKNKFKKYSILFLVIKCISVLKGSRTELAVNILFITYLYYSIYKSEIKKKILLLPIVFIFLFQIIGMFRSKIDFKLISIFELLKNFISEQGVSMIVIGINKIQSINYTTQSKYHIFGNVIDEYLRIKDSNLFRVQSVELAEKSYNIQYILSYLYIPNEYLEGAGIGGNYIAELYNFGGFFSIILGGAIIGYLLPLVQKKMYKKRFISYIFIPLILHIFISPRANLVPFIFKFRIYIYIYICVYILKEILKKLKKQGE